MRPTELNPLFASVQSLDGVGPRVAALLKRVLRLAPTHPEPRVIDLLWHLPTGIVDRRAEPSLADAVPGTIVTLKVRVAKHKAPPRGSRVPYRVHCEAEDGRIDLVFFRAEEKYLERQLPVDEVRHVSGRIERYAESWQMPHPDYIVAPDRIDQLPRLEPIYPLTAGLSGKVLLKSIRGALDLLPVLPEWGEPSLLKQKAWPSLQSALAKLHRPQSPEDPTPTGTAWQRIAYDELLAGQIALALVRQSQKSQRGRIIAGDGRLRAKIVAALPFALTGSQHAALAEIEADMKAPMRMLRLLQGDVGSGKTIVALLAMAIAVESGSQAALMVPTEVLARQHLETIAPLAEAAGIRVALLTGREKGRARASVLEELAHGRIDILVGTHALFQDDVRFKDLAVAVIDEQHRFGVQQRMDLQRKGGAHSADVLVMTATPIPRTLLMTHYGDLDVSRLTEKPAGRKPITTVALPIERIEEVVARLKAALGEGAQVYWVCPLVENSDVSELAAAEERAAYLTQMLGPTVGLVHGQMPGSQRDVVMAEFSAGRLGVLVATTVIEVGVNVPNASIMVIEHAERFGLAQLHQLRGRVGRGGRQSYCMLLYQGPLGESAESRLKTIRETEDGFLIAEMDLKLRGGGEMLGVRQSGLPEFRVANVPNFADLIAIARDDARLILDRDAKLTGPRGMALRTLLYLFDQDEAVRLFRAG
ncbi:MAG: ATP-dependent DNA helicase RecG [Hyphomicrobiaceae bacterium]|nr:MAG: ATP-dependent DNA helicase RecG [Hyphomicrobiaceae bacterium]